MKTNNSAAFLDGKKLGELHYSNKTVTTPDLAGDYYFTPMTEEQEMQILEVSQTDFDTMSEVYFKKVAEWEAGYAQGADYSYCVVPGWCK
jgi:hypothetical protein